MSGLLSPGCVTQNKSNLSEYKAQVLLVSVTTVPKLQQVLGAC